MQSENRLFDDFVKFVNGAAGTFAGMGREAEQGAREWIGGLDFVTHCYRRPRALPAWPYNLFAMVHGASRDECAAKAAGIRILLGDACRGSDILYSTRILKKSGLRISS